ncbi:CHRD domain-containing protein [Paenibacillus sp. 481]|uniref:CHRD domain-containing protein n=1 Tax=Paenibacillus sp. 481 TaxID=2835869 RepID=UPI001E64A34D|nr:CHRD domain-containing protein [Paenibacillus sp. 481]
MKGQNEVPPVNTIASEEAIFRLSPDGTQLTFKLAVQDIKRVTAANIHIAPKGLTGPIVAYLFGPNKFGISVKSGIISGVLTSDDLIGPLQGRTISDLVTDFNNGFAYVNVHTVKHPDGEIRGQVFRAKDDVVKHVETEQDHLAKVKAKKAKVKKTKIKAKGKKVNVRGKVKKIRIKVKKIRVKVKKGKVKGGKVKRG